MSFRQTKFFYYEILKILSESQFGFKENTNTEDAISKLITKIDNKTIVVFLDLQKAFDTVDFSI